jgi:hypothetical protein
MLRIFTKHLLETLQRTNLRHVTVIIAVEILQSTICSTYTPYKGMYISNNVFCLMLLGTYAEPNVYCDERG